MKQMIAVFFLTILFLPCSLNAYSLEGTVYTPEGEPMRDVLIKLLNSQRHELGRDYSDRKGEYSISGLPRGAFTLEATKFSFTKVVFDITISGPHARSVVYRDINFSYISSGSKLTRAGLTDFYLPTDHTIAPKALNAFNKGITLLEKGKVEKAIKSFRKAIEKDSTFSRAHTYMGIALIKVNRFEEGVAHFNKAAALNSSDPLPLLNHGIHLIQTKDLHAAKNVLEKALELDQGLARTHLVLGETYYRLTEWEKAEYELSQGLILNPQAGGSYRLIIANTYVQLNRLADARDQYAAYLRENPYAENKDKLRAQIRKIEDKLSMYQLPDMD
jgi:tetratricopeptide (TPR) repeat protein